jgi:TetR/AcrR family transcriptional regulator, transcriptional repressor for nem operon
MARQKSFDESVSLDRAMVLFWERGYERTSLKDLEVALGLTPPSIYNAFGNKQDLFIKVLERYLEAVVDQRLEQFLRPNTHPLDNVQSFLQSAVGYLVKDKPRFGCLLTNTAIEAKVLKEPVSQIVGRGLNRIRDAFYSELMRAQSLGLLSKDRDIKGLSNWLLTCYQGLLVLARLNISEQQLKLNVQSVMAELRGKTA